MGSLRAKVIMCVLGILAAGVGMIALIGGAWIPVIGGAIAAAAVTVYRVTHRLDKPRCMGCGQDMTGIPVGQHGAVCPKCGSIHMPRPKSVDRQV